MEKKILATVGGQPITNEDVESFLATLGQRAAMYRSPEGMKAVLAQVVSNKLLLLDAKRNLFEAEPAFREELNRVKDNLLTSYATEKIIGNISCTDAEVEKYYEDNKDRLQSGETVNASHILVKDEDEAKKILADIKAGVISFEDAAKEYSSCPSKENGGNLGEFGKGQMVPEFENAAFNMEVGAISEPVKTSFGYHLIKLIEKNESKLPTLDEVKDQLKEMLITEKQQKAYESKINQLKIMYPVDFQ